jgi:small subunit ribosomal protein S14
MAKKSKIVKEMKRREIVERYRDIIAELKEKGDYQALQNF